MSWTSVANEPSSPVTMNTAAIASESVPRTSPYSRMAWPSSLRWRRIPPASSDGATVPRAGGTIFRSPAEQIGLGDALSDGIHRGLHAVVHVELRQDARHVVLHRPR